MDYSEKFPIIDYYKKVVMPVDRKRFWVKSDKMMVCPLHNDVNPSMGVIKSKNGEELYHCFGCNSWGNVVELHRRVSKKLFNRYLSEEDAVKDLCRIFNVKYVDVEPSEEDRFDVDMKQDRAVQDAINNFDISDFREMLQAGKRDKKGVAYFNTLVMIMVDNLKGGEVESK